MAEYLFLHGKIVVDNTRLYEDGAILADEERVLDIFPHASKIKEKRLKSVIITSLSRFWGAQNRSINYELY